MYEVGFWDDYYYQQQKIDVYLRYLLKQLKETTNDKGREEDKEDGEEKRH